MYSGDPMSYEREKMIYVFNADSLKLRTTLHVPTTIYSSVVTDDFVYRVMNGESYEMHCIREGPGMGMGTKQIVRFTYEAVLYNWDITVCAADNSVWLGLYRTRALNRFYVSLNGKTPVAVEFPEFMLKSWYECIDNDAMISLSNAGILYIMPLRLPLHVNTVKLCVKPGSVLSVMRPSRIFLTGIRNEPRFELWKLHADNSTVSYLGAVSSDVFKMGIRASERTMVAYTTNVSGQKGLIPLQLSADAIPYDVSKFDQSWVTDVKYQDLKNKQTAV